MYRKVALIELYEHSEVLRAAYELITPYTREICICTRKAIKQDLVNAGLGTNTTTWHTASTTLGYQDKFPVKWLDDLQTCEWIFFLTINRPFSSFSSFPFWGKTILLIHNTHTFLSPWKYVAWTWKAKLEVVPRLFRFYAAGDYHHLKKILSRCSVWAFPSNMVLQYVISNKWIPSGQRTLTLPLHLGRALSNSVVDRESNTITICIPGTIKENGRNYDLVWQALRDILPQVRSKLKLYLLGRPKGKYGRQIHKQFQHLQRKNDHFSVETYQETISQEVFDAILQQADFLILPLTRQKRYDAFSENVGVSSISGAINDMLRFRIPSIVPDFYPREEHWDNLVDCYSNQGELTRLLTEWIKDRKFIRLRHEFERYQEEWELQRKVFGEWFYSLNKGQTD